MLQRALAISRSSVGCAQGVQVARSAVVFGTECLLKMLNGLIGLVLMQQDPPKMKVREPVVRFVFQRSSKVLRSFFQSSLVEQQEGIVVVSLGIKGTDLQSLAKGVRSFGLPALASQ